MCYRTRSLEVDVSTFPAVASQQFLSSALRDRVDICSLVKLSLLEIPALNERIEIGIQPSVCDIGGSLFEFGFDRLPGGLVDTTGDVEDVSLKAREIEQWNAHCMSYAVLGLC